MDKLTEGDIIYEMKNIRNSSLSKETKMKYLKELIKIEYALDSHLNILNKKDLWNIIIYLVKEYGK